MAVTMTGAHGLTDRGCGDAKVGKAPRSRRMRSDAAKEGIVPVAPAETCQQLQVLAMAQISILLF